jgi:acyl carrier protein
VDKIEQTVLVAVNGILVKNGQVNLSLADMATRNIEDLGFDSMDKLDLVMEIEDQLNMLFANSDLLKCRTVQDLVQFIGKNQ